MVSFIDAPRLEVLSQQAITYTKLKQLVKRYNEERYARRISVDWGDFFHTALVERWSSISGAHLVFHDMTAIYSGQLQHLY